VINIAIGSDHRGVKIKQRLVQSLGAAGYTVFDAGTQTEVPCDYPDFAHVVAKRVSEGSSDRGVLICGTGIGMAIVANKFPGVRAASCYDEVLVEVSRRHNDVNVLCLAGDLIGDRPIDETVLMWLRTEFDGGRHQSRVDKIREVELERSSQFGTESS
jgi:ribose 5-phosphate isomerase B